MHHQLKHPIGLSPDPVEIKPTVSGTATIVKLPYMGPDRLRDDTIDKPYPTDEVRLKQYIPTATAADPYDLLVLKIDRIAVALNVSTKEAERLFFDRV